LDLKTDLQDSILMIRITFIQAQNPETKKPPEGGYFAYMVEAAGQ